MHAPGPSYLSPVIDDLSSLSVRMHQCRQPTISTVTVLVTVYTVQVCPTPQPCHCTGLATSRNVINDDDDDDVEPTVVCSFLRLRNVPYFLTFDADVWTQLDLSQNLLETIPAEALHGVRVQRLR